MEPDQPVFAYIVPLRRWAKSSLTEFSAYLQQLPSEADVIVVDGSAAEIFASHSAELPARVRHVPILPASSTPNGKVGGVIAGMRATEAQRVVIADDDVRYRTEELKAVLARLDVADVVRPQNYFAPLPWHAQWDTARMLLNRMSGGDWPGTLGVRRSAFMRAGGYAGDVLFENFELVRTLRRNGGREDVALDLYVRRQPPDARRFFEQRVRQAYDEFARPARMAAFLAVLPLLAAIVALQAWLTLGGVVVVLVLIAEAGRRRSGGTAYFPWQAALFAPLWLLERGLCSWIALARRSRGGIAYAGTTLQRAAT